MNDSRSSTLVRLPAVIASIMVLVGCHSEIPMTAVEPRSAGQITGSVQWVELQPGLSVRPSGMEIQVEAEICLDAGWLEQIMCAPGTREHESIMVTRLSPSAIHASMLVAGMRPGAPGSWREMGDDIIEVPPSGSRLEILVAIDGSDRWEPVKSWVESDSGEPLEGNWVFGGSFMREADEVPAGYSRYEADLSGSIIGLVTFGDEMIGLDHVIPDQVSLEPAQWRLRESSVPAIGTVVRVLVRSTDR